MTTQTHLPPRLVEILTLLAAGYTRPEVAEKLVLSELTIKSHLQRVREALDARTTMHALVLALSQGLIPMPHGRADDAYNDYTLPCSSAMPGGSGTRRATRGAATARRARSMRGRTVTAQRS